ncbi:MAG: FkbM family methyltransferase, partial [Chitinophagales bacterium]|nr:FkbM family methyltransferase [Chitinophagales bacterium]MDW8427571.1 FkbM family methyltransferase [Chitinophagales bacterium]
PFPGSRKLARVLAHLLLPRPHSPVAVPTVFDFSLLIHPRWHTDVYYLGFYERGTLEVMSACLRPGDTFVDVGAHVGLMSLFAAQCVGPQGKVWAFEPVASLYELLQASIRINGFTQIEAFRYALGDREGEVPIFLGGSCPTLSKPEKHGAVEWVQLRSLDVVLGPQPPLVRMIKIDVEGYEEQVIRGASRLLASKRAPIVCLEYAPVTHSDGRDPLAVFQILKSLQPYRFFQLKKTKSTPSPLVACSAESLRKNDNVFAIPEYLLSELSPSLFG